MDGVGRVDGSDSEPLAGASVPDRRRDSLFMTAKVQIGDTPGVHEVRVRNLSEGGLMAEFERPIQPGTAVRMEMRGLGEVTGTVAWCTRGRLGIALDEPIDPKRARKPVSTGKAGPGYPKPILVARGPRR